jgi:hypothetical protein
MGKTLYLECATGISGDMTAAALLDLGASQDNLKKVLDSLLVKGFEIEISRVKKAGLDACDFHVKLDSEHENHDHDMEYLYGHEHNHDHDHEHHDHDHDHREHDHNYDHNHDHHHDHDHHDHDHHHHDHDHNHNHHGHHHSHEHRGLPEIQEIIRNAQMSARAKNLALNIFQVLAEAEAKAHGVPMDQVHFHEVGAVDSIVDIVAVAVCLDDLDITEVIVPYLCEGQGTVRCQHGILPVPVPAVANIAAAHGLKLQISNIQGELVTPTGAAIVAAIRTKELLPEQFTIQKIGMGAGKREYERPSLLRAMLIEPDQPAQADFIVKLETNIDDCTGEQLGYVMEQLFAHGARDVHYTPVYMKKNRPAYLLTVICTEEKVRELEDILFLETTTIGIRKMKMERRILERTQETISLDMGTVEVKHCVMPDGTVRTYPEYESIAAIGRKTGRSLESVRNQFYKEYSSRK